MAVTRANLEQFANEAGLTMSQLKEMQKSIDDEITSKKHLNASLWYAIMKGETKNVEHLLKEQQADPNGHIFCIDWFECCADKSPYKRGLVQIGYDKDELKKANFYLYKDVVFVPDVFETVSLMAAKHATPKILQLLFKYGMKPDTTGEKSGDTMLHRVNTGTAEFLLSYLRDKNMLGLLEQKNHYGQKPLSCILLKEELNIRPKIRIVELFCEYGAKFSPLDRSFLFRLAKELMTKNSHEYPEVFRLVKKISPDSKISDEFLNFPKPMIFSTSKTTMNPALKSVSDKKIIFDEKIISRVCKQFSGNDLIENPELFKQMLRDRLKDLECSRKLVEGEFVIYHKKSGNPGEYGSEEVTITRHKEKIGIAFVEKSKKITFGSAGDVIYQNEGENEIYKELAIQSSTYANIIKWVPVSQAERETVVREEYAFGGNLDEYIDAHKPLELETIKSISLGILNGLSYMHNRGIAHRDIKPKNIVFKYPDDPSSVCIIDLESATQDFGKDDFAGTLNYFAPEVFIKHRSGQRILCDHREGDIYAFGCIFYHLVVGNQYLGEEDRKRLTEELKGIKPEKFLDYAFVSKRIHLKFSLELDEVALANIPDIMKEKGYSPRDSVEIYRLLRHTLCPEHERWTADMLMHSAFFRNMPIDKVPAGLRSKYNPIFGIIGTAEQNAMRAKEGKKFVRIERREKDITIPPLAKDITIPLLAEALDFSVLNTGEWLKIFACGKKHKMARPIARAISNVDKNKRVAITDPVLVFVKALRMGVLKSNELLDFVCPFESARHLGSLNTADFTNLKYAFVKMADIVKESGDKFQERSEEIYQRIRQNYEKATKLKKPVKIIEGKTNGNEKSTPKIPRSNSSPLLIKQ